MQKNIFPVPATSRFCASLLLLASLVFFNGCSGFSHLTTVDNQAAIGPSAADCGACHVAQYNEWKGSAHNRAYTDQIYREATGDYEEESCLACHIPESIMADELTSRNYSRADGISCTSCHLAKGTMSGPHEGSALIYPHPVKAAPDFYASSALCGICHKETFASWKKSAATAKSSPPVPGCQQCHMALVNRTSTQGTNIFSNALVSFEKKHTVRSHTLALGSMPTLPDAFLVNPVVHKTTPLGSYQPAVSITNRLPHNLPGSEYTESSVFLVITPENTALPADLSSAIQISDTESPLLPGEEKHFTIHFDSFGHPLADHKRYTTQIVLRQSGKTSPLTLFNAPTVFTGIEGIK